MNNILIDTIRISGFRGIKDIEISLLRVTLLIGINNSGKTSVLKAMQLALGDYHRFISDEDFYIDEQENRTKDITVDIRIVPVDENGHRTQIFDDKWAVEFGGAIKSEANNNQFLIIRTQCKPDLKGGFEVSRFTIEKWASYADWLTDTSKKTKLSIRYKGISFHSIEAQRDIHQELKEKNSFSGRILSEVSSSYNASDIKALEISIKNVNDDAIDKSTVLANLKLHLDKLNKSFQVGQTEITPFPKKIRDLSKHFSVNFGDSANNTFSMEYHGMGTRSWASILAMMAFIDSSTEKSLREEDAFFPVVSVEEPEAHLHPSAQKTLYKQLSECKGQIIISTHSPYLAAIANQSELRYLKKESNNVVVKLINPELDAEEKRKLQREIIHSRGEILFSKALVLCEGETEEQALPLLFEKYFDEEAFVFGISFIGVGGSGKKYLPFLRFAKSFEIPIFIFSDGELLTTKNLKNIYDLVYGDTDIKNCKNIVILDNTDFEGYLISSGFKLIIESAIKETDGENSITNWIDRKDGTSEGRTKTNTKCNACNQFIFEDVARDYQSTDGYSKALIDIIDSKKPKYAPIIAEKLCELNKADFPLKILELFNKIKRELGI
jgi:putative ATP-dependent endonuclease of OLD family